MDGNDLNGTVQDLYNTYDIYRNLLNIASNNYLVDQ